MSAKNIMLVVLWVIALGAVCMLLIGCESLREQDKREGKFTVDADCERNRVNVEFRLDQHADDRSVEVKR